MRGPEARDLAAGLLADIDRVVARILPDAQREGRELRGHGPDGGVWSVVMAGRKAGLFCNWSDPDRQRGDMLELVRWGICNGNRSDAYRWAMNWLGISPDAYPQDPEAERARQAALQADRRRREAEALDDAAKRKRAAMGVYLDSVAEIARTPVESYLLHRGLALAEFRRGPKSDRHDLRSLKFAPRCWHSHAVGNLPAMLAPLVRPSTGEVVGVHQTFLGLVPGMPGVWGKAAVAPAKKSFGEKKGNIIPLLKGKSRKGLMQAPEGDLLLIAEGIENALTGALAWPEARVVAGVDIGNLSAIALPAVFRHLVFVADRDGFNPATDQAREAAIARWQAEGREVEIMLPPVGFKDVNDFWRDQRAGPKAIAADANAAADGLVAA